MLCRYLVASETELKTEVATGAGVDKRSVDTWMEPSLFRMNVSTGAPPDFFGPEGQNWGFPTYCWEEMAKDDYRWWRRRLQQLSQCACHPQNDA